MVRLLPLWIVLVIILILAGVWFAQKELKKTSGGPCPRFAPGSSVSEAPDLYSKDGFLLVNLSYNTAKDSTGRTLYCFVTSDGKESPTFHVFPGDHLIVTVKNKLPEPASAGGMSMDTAMSSVCGATIQNDSSVNIHYHGTNVSPACHSDEVIHTLINPGDTFMYDIWFPYDEPPGLYWYHPHVHGLAEMSVQGGASGAIVVEGIENVQPAVAGLPERILTIRDQKLPRGSAKPSTVPPIVPSWDVSVNYVPILFPNYVPARLTMRPGHKEFWRVSNSAADAILDLQVQFDGVPQELQVVGLDGVPTESQDGTRKGQLLPVDHILIPPAGRAEFIVQAPSSAVKNATLVTLAVDTGPLGDSDPARPLIAMQTDPHAPQPALMPQASQPMGGPQRFNGLATAPATKQRALYYSEDNPKDQFFVTVDGATPTLFNPNNPPAITTTQGTVEEWTIENRAKERHNFHIHQIHFMLLERNGVPVPTAQQQVIDTVDLPYWSGTGPYPSIKVRLDFRGADIGDYVYHCHILDHEDHGMMAIIRVLPRI
jgi:FtsP/CotA-like multicopper oxidase with cupredoxin domain